MSTSRRDSTNPLRTPRLTVNASSPATARLASAAAIPTAGAWSWADVGKLYHICNSTSVIFYKNTAILWCSPGERQFLLALDLDKGTKVWQTDVPGGKFGKDVKDWLGTWCTPTIAKIDDHDELILGVPNQVRGYDPATGDMLWSCDGAGRLMYTTPVVTRASSSPFRPTARRNVAPRQGRDQDASPRSTTRVSPGASPRARHGQRSSTAKRPGTPLISGKDPGTSNGWERKYVVAPWPATASGCGL